MVSGSAWPKKASGVATDLTFEPVQEIGLDCGLVDNKVCAIDDMWSGLRFVVPRRGPSVVERALTARHVRSLRPGLVADAARRALRRRRGRRRRGARADYNVAPRTEVLTIVQREPGGPRDDADGSDPGPRADALGAGAVVGEGPEDR